MDFYRRRLRNTKTDKDAYTDTDIDADVGTSVLRDDHC